MSFLSSGSKDVGARQASGGMEAWDAGPQAERVAQPLLPDISRMGATQALPGEMR